MTLLRFISYPKIKDDYPNGFMANEKSKNVIACKQICDDTFYKILLFLSMLY